MKGKILISILCIFPLLYSCREKTENEFTIRRGVNISHWLSQSKKRGTERTEWFTRKDVELIASLGYDHIRLPVDEEQLWDTEGKQEKEAFQLLQNALTWCMDNNLKVIVDLHIIRSHHFNDAVRPLWTDPGEQDKLIGLWTELSETLKEYPVGFLAYEIMNEAVADNPEDWNNLLARAIMEIRKTEPDRKIVVGSNMWQSASTFPDLKIPENDPNLILSFHFYNPFAFTHHEAGWTDLRDYHGPVHYPGMVIQTEDLDSLSDDLRNKMSGHARNYNRDSMLVDIRLPLEFAKKHQLPLYCGEFGCLPNVDEKDRLQWYTDFRSVLEENGVSWANWDYKGGFGIVDREGNPYQDLLACLIPD